MKVTEKLKILGRVENIVGKGENAGYQLAGVVTSPDCVVKSEYSILTFSNPKERAFENTEKIPIFFHPLKLSISISLYHFFHLEEC